jgi:hypothetical protein
MTEIETAWLAGILEGEGCFYLPKNSPHSPVIQMSSTDHDVICRVGKLLECNVTPYRSAGKKGRLAKKAAWQTTIGRRAKVQEVLTAILPHMGKRRTTKIQKCLQAIAAIQLQ